MAKSHALRAGINGSRTAAPTLQNKAMRGKSNNINKGFRRRSGASILAEHPNWDNSNDFNAALAMQSGNEHRRTLQPPAAQVGERLVRARERIAHHLGLYACLRRNVEKLMRVGAREVGD